MGAGKGLADLSQGAALHNTRVLGGIEHCTEVVVLMVPTAGGPGSQRAAAATEDARGCAGASTQSPQWRRWTAWRYPQVHASSKPCAWFTHFCDWRCTCIIPPLPYSLAWVCCPPQGQLTQLAPCRTGPGPAMGAGLPRSCSNSRSRCCGAPMGVPTLSLLRRSRGAAHPCLSPWLPTPSASSLREPCIG